MVNELKEYLQIAVNKYQVLNRYRDTFFEDDNESIQKMIEFYEYVIKLIKTEIILLKGKEDDSSSCL